MYIHTGSQCSEVGFDRGSVLKAAHTSSLSSHAVVVGVLSAILRAACNLIVTASFFGELNCFFSFGGGGIVANMFFLPTGLFHGAEVTWQMIFMNNLLPVI